MTNITIEKVWRHSSVNSSGPTILGSGVQIPSTYFIWSPILYYICYSLCWEKDEKNSWKIINIIIILTIHNLLRQSLSLFLHKVLLNELIVVVAVVSGVIVADHAVVLKPFHSGHDLWTQVLGWTPPFPSPYLSWNLKLKISVNGWMFGRGVGGRSRGCRFDYQSGIISCLNLKLHLPISKLIHLSYQTLNCNIYFHRIKCEKCLPHYLGEIYVNKF